MKKIQIKKPDLKAGIHKLKNLRWKDVKAGYGKWKEHRAAKAEKFRNSPAGKGCRRSMRR